MGLTGTGGITIESTTANPTNIKVPDVDYAYITVLKELTQAINNLANATRKHG